jgi:regulator of sirC expression with transglutaminase-like and TPR domain
VAAVRDLSAFLEVAPDSPDAPQVREILANVRGRNPMMN